jgi:hypothetical protein
MYIRACLEIREPITLAQILTDMYHGSAVFAAIPKEKCAENPAELHNFAWYPGR